MLIGDSSLFFADSTRRFSSPRGAFRTGDHRAISIFREVPGAARLGADASRWAGIRA